MEYDFSINQIDDIARKVARLIGNHKHIAFDAPMGAGKTTFIKALCRVYGVQDEVNSPTFAIVNEYQANNGTIYHFDFYRVNSPGEAVDFGLFDYLDSGNLCLFEWPDCISNLLPDDLFTIKIQILSDGKRRIIVPN